MFRFGKSTICFLANLARSDLGPLLGSFYQSVSAQILGPFWAPEATLFLVPLSTRFGAPAPVSIPRKGSTK